MELGIGIRDTRVSLTKYVSRDKVTWLAINNSMDQPDGKLENLESKNGDLPEYVSRGKRFWVEVAWLVWLAWSDGKLKNFGKREWFVNKQHGKFAKSSKFVIWKMIVTGTESQNTRHLVEELATYLAT